MNLTSLAEAPMNFLPRSVRKTLWPRSIRGPVVKFARQLPSVRGIPTRPWSTWVVLGAAGAVAFAFASRARRRRVRDVMIDDVVTIDANATLTEAAQRMREANVGALPVVEGGRLRGLLTDRDIVVRAVAVGVNPSTVRVGDCATRELVSAHCDWTVDQALQVMSERQVGRLPVVDEADRILGIVTLGSLALRSRKQQNALETAKDVSRRSSRIA